MVATLPDDALSVNEDQNHHQLLFLSTKQRMFGTIDCEAPINGLVASRPIPQFDGTKEIEILTSYHGLVCVGIKFYDKYSRLFLWNPLTKEYKRLSTNSGMKLSYGSAFRLYYNSCEDDYKLMHLIDCNACIYSLKSDSWRRVKSLIFFRNKPEWSSSTCLNGIMYFLSTFETKKFSVIKFDTKTEKFTEIETPSLDNIHDQNSIHVSLLVHTGCIHLCIIYNKGRSYDLTTCIELRKMNEDGYWTKVVTNYNRVDNPYGYLKFKPLHLMRNGDMLMSSYEKGKNLYKLEVLEVKKKKQSKGKGEDMCLPICKDVRYSETFISPNRYSK